jgi:N-formylglutamate amidohydrolase
LPLPAAEKTDPTPSNPGVSAAVWDVLAPANPTAPVVFASPHSGQNYPAAFVAASRLDPVALRRSEDAFIDEIFSAAPDFGAPLLRAHFPRAYVDPNREAFELDPAMFEDRLPDYVNATSPRIEAGLGTIAKVVTNGEEIYSGKLRFAEALERIERFYRPYHKALSELLAATRAQHGAVLLVDCHSMPSIGGPMDADTGHKRVDVVLGDRHGTSCAPEITDLVEETCRDLGFRVTRNRPYAGGFTTLHYGRPRSGSHALQIEINRTLYMDEGAIRRSDGFAALAHRIRELIGVIAATAPRILLPS